LLLILSAYIGVHRRQKCFLTLSAFTCGSIILLGFLGGLGVLGGSIILLGSLGVVAVQVFFLMFSAFSAVRLWFLVFLGG